jgi:lysyl-tRNA synthetase class 2
MSWRPAADLQMLRTRARLLADCRRFFADRNVLEVHTPALSVYASTEPNVASLEVKSVLAAERKWYLHTSPELAMKRLLAAGSGAIYQICTVFRDSDFGSQHRPEFTMLEWYRPGWRYTQLMDEVEALLFSLNRGPLPGKTRRLSYRNLFQNYLAIDPFTADIRSCMECCRTRGITPPANMSESLDEWLDLLLSLLIVPALESDRLTFIYEYPPSQAALAKVVKKDGMMVAERFELYWGPLELANGFQELTDAQEQARRFRQDNLHRSQRGLEQMPVDTEFLSALEAGMEETAGVALGLDRLLMAMTGAGSIDKVIAFDDG